MKMPARFSGPDGCFSVVIAAATLNVAALGADQAPRPGRQRREGDAVLLVGLLDAGAAQVVQDDLAEVVAGVVLALGLGYAVNYVAVLVHAQHPVGGDAFHGEGAGHPHLAAVFVGLVVQVLVVGPGGDGGVNFLLAGDAPLPPEGVEGSGFLGPGRVGFPGNLPLLPGRAQGAVQFLPQGFQFLLRRLPDDVNFGVVGDGAQGDVGHPLVNEPLAHVAVGGHIRRGAAGDFSLLLLPLLAVGQEVVGVAGAHDAGPRQGQGDAGGVDGNPAAPPLLGHVGRGAGAAGGVQHQVAGVGGHQDAALYDFGTGFHDKTTRFMEASRDCVRPSVVDFRY